MCPMDLRPNSDEARDIAYHFHGYTNARVHEQNGPMIMDRGEGVYVFDTQGKRYIEGMAGADRRGDDADAEAALLSQLRPPLARACH